MISYFPKVYSDELLYSVIGRYHKYSGNMNTKDTIRELFGEVNIIPTFDIQGYISSFTKQTKEILKVNELDIIANNTIIPIYTPFMQEEKAKEVVNLTISGNSMGIKHKIGMIAGGICRKNSIYYCPICCKEEFDKYGEVYIHRTHQVEGVEVCERHGCILNTYLGQTKERKYIYLEEKNLNYNIKYPPTEIYKSISEDVHYLLNHNINIYSEDVKNGYRDLLCSKGLASESGRINEKMLYDEFIKFYGESILEHFQSNIDIANEWNWFKSIVRNNKKTIHPLRHILFIEFLYGSVEKFLENIKKVDGNTICKSVISKVYDECNDNKKIIYRNRIKEYTSEFPNINRTELRRNLQKEYIFLYRHDREWLKSNLPIIKKVNTNYRYYGEYWIEKDKKILELVKQQYIELKDLAKPVRITKSIIGIKINYGALLEKKLDKLPNTKEYLNLICESINDFRFRRISNAYKLCENEGIGLAEWKLLRIAGIRYEDRDILNKYNKERI